MQRKDAEAKAARMQALHDQSAAKMKKLDDDHRVRMKEFDDEAKRFDRVMKWVVATIIVIGVVGLSVVTYLEAGRDSTRDRWAHRFCRQTCRALDYRPLMFYRLPRLDAEKEAVARHTTGSNKDGLICRCAGPNDTIHLFDEDGDGHVMSGRDYPRFLNDEGRRRARELREEMRALARARRETTLGEAAELMDELAAVESEASRGKNQ
jgi:hypothetical protein